MATKLELEQALLIANKRIKELESNPQDLRISRGQIIWGDSFNERVNINFSNNKLHLEFMTGILIEPSSSNMIHITIRN